MVRHVSQPPFLAQPGGRQQVGIVATVCENAEPRYQNPTQEKELPERNQIGQWHEENGPRSVSKHSGSTTPGRLIDTLNNESPGILWDMPTLSVQFDIGDIARFSTSSSPVQPFVENQDIYLESKAKPSSGIHSLLSTRFKKHSSTDTFDLTDNAKGHESAQVTRPFFEKRVEGTQVQPTLPRFTGVEMEDPEEKTSVRSIDLSSQRGGNPTCSTKKRMRCDWRDTACLIAGKKCSAKVRNESAAQERAASSASRLPAVSRN